MGIASSKKNECNALPRQSYDFYAMGKGAPLNFFQRLVVECFTDDINRVDFCTPDWLSGKVACLGLSVQTDPWKVSLLVGISLIGSVLFLWILTKLSRKPRDPLLGEF
jgi:hypothetical protein